MHRAAGLIRPLHRTADPNFRPPPQRQHLNATPQLQLRLNELNNSRIILLRVVVVGLNVLAGGCAAHRVGLVAVVLDALVPAEAAAGVLAGVESTACGAGAAVVGLAADVGFFAVGCCAEDWGSGC